jgi:hypothetical protein
MMDRLKAKLQELVSPRAPPAAVAPVAELGPISNPDLGVNFAKVDRMLTRGRQFIAGRFLPGMEKLLREARLLDIVLQQDPLLTIQERFKDQVARNLLEDVSSPFYYARSLSAREVWEQLKKDLWGCSICWNLKYSSDCFENNDVVLRKLQNSAKKTKNSCEYCRMIVDALEAFYPGLATNVPSNQPKPSEEKKESLVSIQVYEHLVTVSFKHLSVNDIQIDFMTRPGTNTCANDSTKWS